MIFQTTKKMQSVGQLVSWSTDERGITLILAILLLASILSISFSLASVLFIEVRSSSDLIRTDSALYGANGVAEQAIFNVRRKVASSTVAYISQFSNNTNINGAPSVTTTSTPTFEDVVQPNNNFNTTPNVYNFCDISAGSSGCGYSKAVLTYLATGNSNPLIVYFCEFDPNSSYGQVPCTSTSTPSYWITNQTGLTNQTPTYPHGGYVYSYTSTPLTTWTLNPLKQQELILFSNSPDPIYFSLKTFDTNGVPKGLPLAGKSAINVNVTNGQTGRKIQVIVPTQ